MTGSTVFTQNETQVWTASNGVSEFYFPRLDGEGGVQKFLEALLGPQQWEQDITAAWDYQLGVIDGERPCSRVIGTGWRVWRHR